MSDAPEPEAGRAIWADALRVASLVAAGPQGCCGVWLKAGAGPVRDAWLAALRAALDPAVPFRRMPPSIADDRLLGGLDLAATLSAGRPVAQTGLLAEADGGLVLVPMAERLPAGTSARLAAVLDSGTVCAERDGLTTRIPARIGLILLDEGLDDERAPAALTERLAFHLDLTDLGLGDIEGEPPLSLLQLDPEQPAGHPTSSPQPHPECLADQSVSDSRPHPEVPRSSLEGGLQPAARSLEGSFEARLRLTRQDEGERVNPAPIDRATFQHDIEVVSGNTVVEPASESPYDAAASLCTVAEALGIASLRGPLLALRTARLTARLDGRDTVTEDDAMVAARLVLAPRATRLPVSEQDRQPPPPSTEETEPQPDTDQGNEQSQPPEDLVLEAARAAIPPGLLALIAAGGPKPRAARTGKAGTPASAARSGRPAGTRPGDPRRERLDLVATLRAAAPWQRIRRAERPAAPGRVLVRSDDIRIRRYRQHTETTTIFVVDASGSAALERLAEAKGAVELLLAEAYVRRDKVALVAFRGRGAELLLPPTRSLVRARRSLAGLPGGGGTPLAAGLDAGTELALCVRRGGGTPLVVVLTDGRANIARSGEPGRARAGEDALAAGRLLRASNIGAILVDTAPRPQETARRLAEAMAARYLPLPHADAGTLSLAVKQAAQAAPAAA